MSELHPLIGALIDGKYRVDSVLGSGGMGVVFLARHEQLRERVAIKVLKPERGGRPQLVERLFREARAAASLRSQHVVRVLDVGTIKPDAQPFIVMEYLQGEDLAACLVRRGPLPVRDAVDYLLEACEAVAEAHALGIVHRDLKPANLFLERRASGAVSVKVLDFGVARFLAQHLEAADPDAALTSTHSFVGSPAYVSPEQLSSPERVDTRADVWALGVILYECLSCAQPFKAPTLALTCTKILQETPPDLERSDVPPELVAALERALEKDPEERFASVLELAIQLAPHGSDKSRASLLEIEAVDRAPRVTSPTPVPRTSESGSATLTGSVLQTYRAVGSARRRFVVSVLAFALVLSVLLGYLTRRKPAASSASAMPPPAAASVSSLHSVSALAEPGLAPAALTLPVATLASSAPVSAAQAVRHADQPAPKPAVSATPPSLATPRPPSNAAFSSSPATPAPTRPAPSDESERLYEFRR